MKKTFLAMISSFLLLGSAAGLYAASTTSNSPSTAALLSTVSGKVTLKSGSGKSRKGLQGAKVYQGETVKVGKASKATLTLFDGSALELQSNTQIVLSKLKRTSEKEKNLKFKLSFGSLFAKVKKLLTPTSSFEVEAGGAICGVRGTQYNISYDPDTNKTTIKVTEGSVYFNIGGTTYVVHAGESLSFTNGHPDKGPAQGPTGDKGALDDLEHQFVGGIITNGDNNLTDPAVGGSVKVNVTAGVPAGEAVP